MMGDEEAGGVGVAPGRLSLKIPRFTGTESRVEVAGFLMKAQSAIAAAGLAGDDRSEEAAGYLAHALADTALQWYQTVTFDDPDLKKDYQRLLTSLKNRFEQPLTVNELQQLKTALKQKKGEPVRAFYDRCAFVQSLELSEATPEQKATDFYKNTRDRYLRQKFLEGLLPDLKSAVQAQSKQCTTLNDFLVVAHDVEIAMKREAPNTKDLAVEEVDGAGAGASDKKKEEGDKEEKGDEFVVAIKKSLEEITSSLRGRGAFRRGNGRGGFGRGGRGRGRGWNNWNNNNQCWNCGQFGHFQRNCMRGRGRGNYGYNYGYRGRGRGNNNGNGNGNNGNNANKSNVAVDAFEVDYQPPPQYPGLEYHPGFR